MGESVNKILNQIHLFQFELLKFHSFAAVNVQYGVLLYPLYGFMEMKLWKRELQLPRNHLILLSFLYRFIFLVGFLRSSYMRIYFKFTKLKT